jgi:hypothetical protein
MHDQQGRRFVVQPLDQFRVERVDPARDRQARSRCYESAPSAWWTQTFATQKLLHNTKDSRLARSQRRSPDLPHFRLVVGDHALPPLCLWRCLVKLHFQVHRVDRQVILQR